MIKKSLAEKMKDETIDFDILYCCLIGTLVLEKTREFLWDYYEMKEDIQRIEKRKNGEN